MSNFQKRFYVLRKINQLKCQELRVKFADMLFYSDKSSNQILKEVKAVSL